MSSLIAAEGPNGFWLPGDIKEFWWSTAAFLVVLALMIWKLLPLVRKAMADRSERIRDEIVAAEKSRKDAEAELAALRAKLGDSSAEAERIMAEARSRAQTVKADLIARAEADSVDAQRKAEIEMSATRGQAAADIQAAVAEQAARAAESVVRANLDDRTHADLIDRYIQRVETT